MLILAPDEVAIVDEGVPCGGPVSDLTGTGLTAPVAGVNVTWFDPSHAMFVHDGLRMQRRYTLGTPDIRNERQRSAKKGERS